jgi:hypothetical protein
MKTLETSIDIDAPPEQVWGILMDFARYPEWNPFIRRIRGKAVAGARLAALLQPPGTKALTFHPRVRIVVENREFRWLGRLLIPGIFDGEHLFVLEPIDGGTRFHQKENFRGLLVPFLNRMIEGDTRRGFTEMNKALKERAERK